VDAIVKEAESGIADTLLGKSCGKVDYHTYIATAHLLFEALSGDEVEVEVDWDSVVSEGAPAVDGAELAKAVDQLVRQNLFSYVDTFTVSLHSRRLKWAYKNVCKHPAVKKRVAAALAALK
jgi:hypothetical protein